MVVSELQYTLDNEDEIDDEVIENADDQDDAPDVLEYWITSFGIDYDVEGIYRRLTKGDIDLPGYQRAYVWSKRRASRFIESLLMRLPVPGIFLYREPDSLKQMVIDGQQRLETLRRYYDGRFGNRDFALVGVRQQYEGQRYTDLTDENRRKLDDSIIHATVIRQDKPDDGGSSQFAIFERLNTNATPLSAQEIRAASFAGQFNDLLVELNDNLEWRQLFGRKHRRRRDEELILRFIALYFRLGDYKRPMKGFMNDFMSSNRNLEKYSRTRLQCLFNNTISTVLNKLGPDAFKPTRAVNASLFDALMVGIGCRLEKGPILSEIRGQFDILLEDKAFRNVIDHRTSDVERVKDRIRLATEAFADAE